MQSLKIIEMDHIVLNVKDVERSLTFYMGTLGLKGERIEEFRKGEVGFPSVRITADTLIDLQHDDSTEARPPRRNLHHFCLVADAVDLELLSSTLKNEGITVTQEPVSRWGAHGRATSIYLLDPDLNEIEIRCY